MCLLNLNNYSRFARDFQALYNVVMLIFWTIFFVAAVYFFLAFFVLRLIAPFMQFGAWKYPKSLPENLQQVLARIYSASDTQAEFLQKAYDEVYKHFYATRTNAVLKLPKLFRSDIGMIWNQGGYAHCVSQNYILACLLVASGKFITDDILVRHVFLNFVPHQYLRIKVGDKWIAVDPLFAGMKGLGLGAYGRYFG